MDEKTPHMHVIFVPLTQDNRLCAKEIIGNRTKLIQWQDDFFTHMVAMFPDLERGEIIERGNHEELLALGGRYYELYTGVKELD